MRQRKISWEMKGSTREHKYKNYAFANEWYTIIVLLLTKHYTSIKNGDKNLKSNFLKALNSII